MSGFGNAIKGQVLDHLFGKIAWTPPSTLWVALSTVNPQDDGSTLAEPADTYTRIATSSGDWGTAVAANQTTIKNIKAVNFPFADNGWGTITHFALMDAATAGNLLVHGVLTEPTAVLPGFELKFPISTLTIQLD